MATVDPVAARAYAAATNDANRLYADGRYAPPVFGVVPTWDGLLAAFQEAIPATHLASILHLEQDMLFHLPLVAGLVLTTEAELYSVRASRIGSRVTVRTLSCDEAGTLVLEQFATMFVRGMTGGEDVGPEPPGHGFPDGARERPVGVVTRQVDPDQTYRYRDASGDTNPIHVEDEIARSVGLPGIILHGLCTMAMCGSVVVDRLAGGEPARLARLAVRFSKPVFPGSDLTVALFEGDAVGPVQRYAFEATSGGKLVVRDGLAEVRR